MMKWDPSLVNVMKGRNRGRPELVQAALLALERLVPLRVRVESGPSLEAVEASPSLEAVKISPSLEAVHGAIIEIRSSTKSILDYSTLKQIYDGPNWNASPRLSRNCTSTTY